MTFLLLIVLGIPLALLRGLVLSDLVGWFTPFHLGVVQAIGLAMIVVLFTSHLKTAAERQPDQSNFQFGLIVMVSQLITILVAGVLATSGTCSSDLP